MKRHLRNGPADDVEVIHLVAIGRAAWMVAFGHQNHIAIGNGHGFIEAAIFSKDTLEAGKPAPG